MPAYYSSKSHLAVSAAFTLQETAVTPVMNQKSCSSP